MAALAVVAMLWGNCFSCPDMLAAMTSRQADHSCCHKPQTASAKCHTEDMQHFVKADTHAPIAPAVTVLAALPVSASLSVLWLSAPLPSLHAPPEAPNLLTTLRI
jgi:hypothetical protein